MRKIRKFRIREKHVMNLLKVDGRMSDSMEASMLTQEQDQSGFGSFFGGAESSSFQVRHYKEEV